ncbi:MAG: hypothetical protein NVS3B14_22090 [Ktedonobacteraceae bacterium]
MSQEMHYDEAGRERPRPPQDSYDAGYQTAYRDPFAGAAGQKLAMPYPQAGQGITANQRLALAIVSIVMLVPLAGIVFGSSLGAGGGLALMAGLIGLGVICLTIMVINIVFNRH